ncbi:MAG: YfhO family protein, partial [Salinibacter sp.]
AGERVERAGLLGEQERIIILVSSLLVGGYVILRKTGYFNWPMFAYFPFFNSFRAPETWLSVSALGLAVLAGIGLDYAMRPSADRETPGRSRSLLYAFGAVAGFVLLLIVGKGTFFDFESPRESQIVQKIEQSPRLSRSNPKVRQFYQRLDQRKQQRQDAFRADATRTLLAVVVALLFLWLYRRETLPGWATASLVVLIVLVDLWGVARRHLGEDTLTSQQSTEAQIPTYGFDRYIKKQRKAAGGPGHFRVLPLQAPYVQSPMNSAMPSYHYQQIGGYHAAKLQRYQDYIDHILQLGEQGPPNENALDLMNTRYILAQQRLPGTEVVYRDQQTKTLVLKNPDAVPRGFLVGNTQVIENPRKTWARLRSPSFDPRSTALLSEPIDAPVTPIDSGSTAEVTLESYTPPEIRWTVETDAPRLFVASEVYYPAGWSAYLDGEKVPIHRVDYLLRGVHVPEGEHTLVMRFEPAAHRYGTWISAVATVVDYGGVAVLGIPYLRRRLLPGEEEEDEEDATD